MKKYTSDGAHARARALRRTMTDAETALWNRLRSRQIGGHHFRRQVPLGSYIADFVCHDAKLIIELDGGQHDQASAPEISRTKFLEDQGYKVLRFWNHDVLANIEGVYVVIEAALRGAG